MKFATGGTPQFICYSTNTLTGTGSLRYAYSVSDGGNNGEGSVAGKWQCTTIDTGARVGMYASLDLDNESRVHFAYCDGGLGNLTNNHFSAVSRSKNIRNWFPRFVSSAISRKRPWLTFSGVNTAATRMR